MLIHVVVKREDGEYVAHALEFDLMSAGHTPEDAIRAIKYSMATHVEVCKTMGLDPRDCGQLAPQEFYDEYKQIVPEIASTDLCDHDHQSEARLAP